MSQLDPYPEVIAALAAETLAHFLSAKEDGVIDGCEQLEMEARLRQLALGCEIVSAACLLAIQIIRIPDHAPNQPLWAKIKGIVELGEVWRDWLSKFRRAVPQSKSHSELAALVAEGDDLTG